MNKPANSVEHNGEMPAAAMLWGWAGILPFAILAGATIYLEPGDAGRAHQLLVAYGAIILTFIGGVHWGLAMTGIASSGHLYTVGILPSIAAFAAVLAAPRLALVILVGGFMSLVVYDVWLARRGDLPPWYGTLRPQLTAVVVALLCVAGLFGQGSSL